MKMKSTKRRARHARAKRVPSHRAQGLTWLQRRPHPERGGFAFPEPLPGEPDMNWTWQGVRRASRPPL